MGEQSTTFYTNNKIQFHLLLAHGLVKFSYNVCDTSTNPFESYPIYLYVIRLNILKSALVIWVKYKGLWPKPVRQVAGK